MLLKKERLHGTAQNKAGLQLVSAKLRNNIERSRNTYGLRVYKKKMSF